MCGIVGEFNFKGKVEPELIKKMAEKIKHRGPDDQGFYIKDKIGLGHKRLAILDLKTGHQPIFNEDKKIVIVFNGEIYNFLDLKKKLLLKHKFSTKTDTEVIVHLYEEEGEKFLKKLNGDFAFALWDKKNEKLILARDRIGIKPLYYFIDHEKLIFASETPAIFIKKEINLSSLNKYFSFSYIPGEETIYKGIKKLLPGHYLGVQGKGVRVKVKKYWDLNYEQRTMNNEQEVIEKFRELLLDSIKIRLLSDVPLGVFLSGGIDSSTIVALMSKLKAKIKTFSINCGKGIYNELPYARIIAKKYKTEHHEFEIKPNLIGIWPKLIKLFDKPYGNSSALPTFFISKLAKPYATVLLSGEGGDEVLSGYSWYRVFERILKWRLAYKTLPKVSDFLYLASFPPPLSFQTLRTYFRKELKEKIYSDYLKSELKNDLEDNFLVSFFEDCQSKDLLKKALYSDLKTNLPEDLLFKLDRAGMVNALEGRVPFLDHRLVLFLASLPYKFLKNKYILRKAMEKELPKETLLKKKRGMAIPISDWLRSDLKDYAKEILLKKHPYFNQKNIEKMLQLHESGKRDFGNQLFMLISFLLWEKECL